MRVHSYTTEIFLLLGIIQFILCLEIDIFIDGTGLRSIDFSNQSQLEIKEKQPQMFGQLVAEAADWLQRMG